MNLHYNFWVTYYDDLWKASKVLSTDGIQRNNQRLTEQKWKLSERNQPAFPGVSLLYFKVGYPGLLSGLGNSHASGKKEKNDAPEIGLGFLLDPVTSLPYLPGSTVKGILRSAFMMDDGGYIAEVLEEQGVKLDKAQILKLEEAIFGNRTPQSGYAAIGGDFKGTDCFLDAYPIKADETGHILGIENITPHRAKTKELQGLTAPIPLNLLKIMPDVVIQFRFVLKDTTLQDKVEISAQKKLDIFQQILLDLGAGAKTNVGFGSLEALKAEEIKEPYHYLVQEPEAEPLAGNRPAQRPERQQKDTNRSQPSHIGGNTVSNAPIQRVTQESDIQKGMLLQGEVNGFDSHGNFYVTLISGTRVSGKLDGRRLKRKLTVAETVTVRVFDIRDGWDKRRNQPRKNYILDLI